MPEPAGRIDGMCYRWEREWDDLVHRDAGYLDAASSTTTIARLRRGKTGLVRGFLRVRAVADATRSRSALLRGKLRDLLRPGH